MPLPLLPFRTRYTTSKQLISGGRINEYADMLTSFQGGIVALAGGGRTGSPTLNAAFVELATVATGADSVQLPVAKVGLAITITNSGANSAQIFANGTDTINGTAGATGVALAAAATAEFICTKDGVWKRYVSS
jgi:hypothetical protein